MTTQAEYDAFMEAVQAFRIHCPDCGESLWDANAGAVGEWRDVCECGCVVRDGDE